MVFFWRRRWAGADLSPDALLIRKLHIAKVVQCVVLVTNLVICASLAGHIAGQRLSVGGPLPVSIIMAGVSLLATFLADWFGRNLHWYERRAYIVLLILTDMTLVGTQIAAIIVLTAAGGLPQQCRGVASARPGEGNRDPKPGFDTLGFGDFDTKGELDELCPIPRLSWVISLLLSMMYIYTTGCCIRLVAALGRKQKQRTEPSDKDVEEFPAVQGPPQPPPPVEAVRAPHAHPGRHVDYPHPQPITAQDTGAGRWSGPATVPASPPPYTDEGSVADGIPPMKAAAHDKSKR